MYTQKRELKLRPMPSNALGGSGYVANLRNKRTLSYDEVLAEVDKMRVLNIPAATIRIVIDQFFSTVIANTLEDGNTRRIGDYFSIGLNVKGRFDELGDDFDPEKHHLELAIRPLKRLKEVIPLTGIEPYNRNAGPKVVINRVYSSSSKRGNTIVFGEDIIIEGENLFILPNWGYTKEHGLGDSFSIAFYTQKSGKLVSSGRYDPSGVTVSEDGRRMTISWEKAFTNEFLTNHPEAADPKKNAPVALMIGMRTHGGDAKSKRQLHRARAFFDSWLDKYPDYNTKGFRWGYA